MGWVKGSDRKPLPLPSAKTRLELPRILAARANSREGANASKMKRDERSARARNRNKGTRTPEDPCALIWAIENLPEELWARGMLCPAGRAVMLGATSKRVRALLARMQRGVPAAVHVVRGASMDTVTEGLVGLQKWCQVVRLDLKRG